MIKWQTETPVPYKSLTPAQMAEICNGCGGKGGWVKPPHRIFFETSCHHHDWGYSCGGTEADRLNCDLKLMEAMEQDCESLPWWKQIRYRPWCLLYYAGVRICGSDYFYYGQKRWPDLEEN